MTTLVTVPQSGDVLAERYRAAWKKTEGGRAQWIEGTLDLAVVMKEAKIDYPGNGAFSQWLYSNNLKPLHPNDRAALVGFSNDLKAARKMIENSNSISWRVIWEKRERGAKRAPTKIGKSAPRKKSGSQNKKYVPSVMRDDPPEPPPVRKAIVLKGLTREEVDPDFKGTAVDFAAKYGPVNLHTKAEIEDTKRQEFLAAWLGAVADLDRASRAMLTALAAVDPATLQEWTSKPAKADKLKIWSQRAREASQALCAILGGGE